MAVIDIMFKHSSVDRIKLHHKMSRIYLQFFLILFGSRLYNWCVNTSALGCHGKLISTGEVKT